MVISLQAMPPGETGSLTIIAPTRRHTRSIFGVLGATPGGSAVAPPGTATAEPGAALDQHRWHFGLPAELRAVPGRAWHSPAMQAAGFSDPHAASVGVDLARWVTPCSRTLDEIAWRRIFTWAVWADDGLAQVSILEPPARHGDCMVGAYAYEINGVQGYGVLRIAAGDDAWYVCDCWGDATDAGRIDAISNLAA